MTAMRSVCSPVPAALPGCGLRPCEWASSAVAAPADSLVPAQAPGPSSEHQPQHYSALTPPRDAHAKPMPLTGFGLL